MRSVSQSQVGPAGPMVESDLWGFQCEALATATVGGISLGLGLIFAAALVDRLDPGLFTLGLALAATAWASRSCLERDPHFARAILLGGFFLVISGALILLPLAGAGPWFGALVLLAGAVGGGCWAAALTLAATGTLLLAAKGQTLPVEHAHLFNVLAFLWTTCFLSWLLLRPLQTALLWAWQGYSQATEAARRAQEQQSALARLARSLADSYDRLEALSRDVEQARRAAEEARRLKEQFATTISHELRTPLNLIIGLCEMMVLSPQTAYRDPLPSSYREDLEAIYRNACHISTLIDDILDLSRIEADRLALMREWQPLGPIVTEAVAAVTNLYRDRGLFLDAQLPEDLPPLFVDRVRIRQILINLLVNAARVVEQGGVTITAALNKDSVTVAVRDTGPGIAPEDLPLLFEPYRQFGERQRRGSSGLGLAVSRHFAEAHGGWLWAESALGHGTTFYLRLPVHPSENARGGGQPAPAVRRSSRFGYHWLPSPIRRLVALDASSDVRRLFQRYLEGFQVLEGWSGTSEGPVHGFLAGSSEGVRRWQVLIQEHPEWRTLPLVCCRFRTAADWARDLGVAAYLVKPITREQLQQTLRTLPQPIRRLLLVEDHLDLQRLLVYWLQEILPDGQIEAVADGWEALERLSHFAPDAVLLDLILPGLDGWEVLRRLRAGAVRPAVVILSAQEPESAGWQTETIVLHRSTGFSAGEALRVIRGGLGLLWGGDRSGTESPADSGGSPAWAGTPRPQGDAPLSVPEEPNR